MKRSFTVLAALVLSALLIALCFTGCGKEKTPDDPGSVQKLVEEIAVDRGAYGDEANDRIDKLLKDLSAADAGAGARWTKIMDIWRSDDLGQPLNFDVLPDGLPQTDELCIVVLGFQLNPDGSMKDELIERLKVAYNSAVKYPNAYVVCTGGGTASENEAASEAGEMAKWLAERGVDEKRLIVEDNSITTAQNALFTYDILTSLYPGVNKLAIVSSDYHISTGELLFKAEAIIRANAPSNEKLEVISNAAWKAPSGTLSEMFRAGALIELFGDVKTAFEIYYDNYDIHSLPPLGGATVTEQSASSSGRPRVESLVTIGDALDTAEPLDRQHGFYDGNLIYVFKLDDRFYRARAPLTKDEYYSLVSLDPLGEGYDAEFSAAIRDLKIDRVEDLSGKILSAAELEKLSGRTGADLTADGWVCTGFDANRMIFYMQYDCFCYTVTFEGTLQPVAAARTKIEPEEMADLTVISAEFDGLGDATDPGQNTDG